jgi:hypothetical protein
VTGLPDGGAGSGLAGEMGSCVRQANANSAKVAGPGGGGGGGGRLGQAAESARSGGPGLSGEDLLTALPHGPGRRTGLPARGGDSGLAVDLLSAGNTDALDVLFSRGL